MPESQLREPLEQRVEPSAVAKQAALKIIKGQNPDFKWSSVGGDDRIVKVENTSRDSFVPGIDNAELFDALGDAIAKKHYAYSSEHPNGTEPLYAVSFNGEGARTLTIDMLPQFRQEQFLSGVSMAKHT